MPSLVTERIESVKAGIIGAGAFAIAELVVILARSLIIIFILKYNSETVSFDLEWLWQLAIGTVSGFLFGVTYRYIIRDDHNSHLNDGAVLAFGLVRGLALVEDHFNIAALLSLIILVIQSIICFAIARLVLDLAMTHKLVKPFRGEES